MIKQFFDYCISSIIELKTKVLMEIGFVSGASLGAIFDGAFFPEWLQDYLSKLSLPPLLSFMIKPEFWEWLVKNSAEGFIHGAGGVLASIAIAATFRKVKRTYTKIKDRIKSRKRRNGISPSNS